MLRPRPSSPSQYNIPSTLHVGVAGHDSKSDFDTCQDTLPGMPPSRSTHDPQLSRQDSGGFEESPSAFEENTLFGWSLPSVYCILVMIFFPVPFFYILLYVESDPAALVIDGQELPWRYIFCTKTAFATGLLLDFVTWLWTVDSQKAKLFIFPIVIYEALSNGYTPILLDFRGRRIITLRYVQWAFTTPTMLYLYSIVSWISRKELFKAMLMDVIMIVTGFLASWLSSSVNIVALAISFTCFYFVIHAINNMLTIAIDDCAPADERYRNSLVWARIFMTLTWAAIPVVWCSAALDMISVTTEEILYEFFDVTSKAGVSCMLLHTSIQTYAQKQNEKLAQALERDRQSTILAMHEASQQKLRFFAAISHELRTPLNAMIGLADGIMAGSCGEMNSKVLQRLQTIKVSGQRLCVLVNDILDASSLKAENGLQLCEDILVVSDLCGHVIKLTTPLVKKGVELNYTIGDNLPTICADAARIKQILHNVLGNAAKFTESGMVTLAVFMDDTGCNCVFKVSDTGPGIPADKIDNIWGAFNQGDEELPRKYGGAGLGLTIAKQLVEAHGGTIRCESTVSVGTTFTINIPIKLVGGSQNNKTGEKGKEQMNGYAGSRHLWLAKDHGISPSDSPTMLDRKGSSSSQARRSPVRGVSPLGTPKSSRTARVGSGGELRSTSPQRSRPLWVGSEGEQARGVVDTGPSPHPAGPAGPMPLLTASSNKKTLADVGEVKSNSPFHNSVVLPKTRDPTGVRSSFGGVRRERSLSSVETRRLGGLNRERAMSVAEAGGQDNSVLDLLNYTQHLKQRSLQDYKEILDSPEGSFEMAGHAVSGHKGSAAVANFFSSRCPEEAHEHHEWKRVLLVGVAKPQCAVLEAILLSNGFKVKFATNPDNAIDVLQDQEHQLIDCILIDLPNELTLDLCKDLRRLFPGYLPIIIITEKPDDDSVIKCFDLGASDFIKKPFDKSEVLARVQTQIKLRDLTLKKRKTAEDSPVHSLSSTKKGAYSNELRSFKNQVLIDDLRQREAKLVQEEQRLEEQRLRMESREKEMRISSKTLEDKQLKLKKKERMLYGENLTVDIGMNHNRAMNRFQYLHGHSRARSLNAASEEGKSGSPVRALLSPVSVDAGDHCASPSMGELEVSELVLAFEGARTDYLLHCAAVKEAKSLARKLRDQTLLLGDETMDMVFRGQDLDWMDSTSITLSTMTDLQLWLVYKLGGRSSTLPELSHQTDIGILLQHLGLEHYSDIFEHEEVFSFKDLLRLGEGFLEKAGVHTRMSRKRIFSGARTLQEVMDLVLTGSVATSPVNHRSSIQDSANQSMLSYNYTPSPAAALQIRQEETPMVRPRSTGNGTGGSHRKSVEFVSSPSWVEPAHERDMRFSDTRIKDQPLNFLGDGHELAEGGDEVYKHGVDAVQGGIAHMDASSLGAQAASQRPNDAAMSGQAPSIQDDEGKMPEQTQGMATRAQDSDGRRGLEHSRSTEQTHDGMDVTALPPRRSSLQAVIKTPPDSPPGAHAGH